MPGLQKRVLEANFLKGLDTKTDPKDINDGRMLLIQNGVLTLGTSIRKRNGYTALGNTDINGNPITVGSGLASYKNELVELNPWGLFSLEQASNRWIEKGLLPMGMAVTDLSVVRNNAQQSHADSASTGKTAAFAYEDSSGGVRLTVMDEATGNIIQNNVLISATGYTPRLLTSGSTLFLFYGDTAGTTLRARTITDAAPQTLSAPTTLKTTLVASGGFDACPDAAGAFVVAYLDSVANHVIVFGLSTGLAIGTSTNLVPAAAVTGVSLSQNQNAAGTVGGTIVLGMIEANKVESISWTTGTFSATVVSAQNPNGYVGTNNIAQVAPFGTITSNNLNLVAEEVSSSTTGSPVIKMSINGGAAIFVAKGQHLCSHAFSMKVDDANHGAVDQADFVVIANITANLQPKYFVIRTDAGNRSVVYGKFLENQCGGAPTKTQLMTVSQIGPYATPVTGKYLLAGITQFALASVNGSFVTQNGVTRVTIDTTLSAGYQSFALGGNLHVPGSAMQSYDGGVVVEQNFHHFPEGGSFAQSGASYTTGLAGFLTAGVIKGPTQVEVTVGNAASVLNPESSIYSSIFHPIQFACGYGAGTDFDYYEFAPIDANGRNPAGYAPIQPNYFSIGIHYYFNAQGVLIQDSPLQVAQAIVNAINQRDRTRLVGGVLTSGNYGALLVGVNPGSSGASFFLFSPGAGAPLPVYMPLALSTQFTVFDTQAAVDIQFVGCPDGAHIQSGQYFKIVAVSAAGLSIPYYGWFKVDGVGSDPTPVYAINGLPGVGFQININSTDTAETVAIQVKNAINAADVRFLCNVIADITSAAPGFVVQVQQTNSGKMAFAATNITVTGNIPDNSYGYVYVFKWLDNQGQIHRSAPSQPAIATVTGGGFGTVICRVPTLKLTSKQTITSRLSPANPATGAFIEVYRTAPSQSGGNVYYNLTPGNTAVANDPTKDVVTFTDTNTDQNIIGNEQLYCNGNIGLGAYYPPPPHTFVFHHKDRLICGGLEDQYALAFSRKKSPGIGVNFHPVQQINLEPAGGPITAAGSLDDKLIIFQGGQLWAIFGDGPDDNGGSQQFSLPQLVSSQTGAVNQGSIEVIPAGLIFKSTKGIFLLDRKLTVTYIGADVEAYNGLAINDSQTVSNTTQVRFTAGSNTTLVYDYYYGQWSTFQLGTTAGTQPVAQALWNGVYCYLEADGVVQQEMPGQFNDNGVAVSMKIQSGWFNFAGIQGYQRLDRFGVLGNFSAGATMSFGCRYNYDDSFTETPTDIVVAPGLQMRVNTRKPKCMSMSLVLQDIPSGINQDCIISAISFAVKVKTGLFKPGQNAMTG